MLPDGLIFEIALRLAVTDLYSFRLVSKRFNSFFQLNEYFWQCKYFRDFGEITFKKSWQEAYKVRMFGDIFISGIDKIGSADYGDREHYILSFVPDLKAKTVHVGDTHGAIIDPKGSVWTFGSNSYGQLGFSETDRGYYLVPTLVPEIKVKDIALGSSHTVVLDTQGKVWTFGNNYYGQLGIPEINGNLYHPVCISKIRGKAVAAGYNHTLVISLDSTVWAFGKNTYGQLGLGDTAKRTAPTQIPGALYAKSVAGGHEHSVVLDTEGIVWTFGWNYFGQLGISKYLYEISGGSIEPVRLENYNRIKLIAAGGNHTIVSNSETIWFFGDLTGRLTGIKVKEISTSFNHTLLIDTNGTVWAFGENNFGQLGIDPSVARSVKLSEPISLSGLKVRSVSAGFNFSLIAGWKMIPKRET